MGRSGMFSLGRVLIAGAAILACLPLSSIAQELPGRPAPLRLVEVTEPNGQILSYRHNVGSTDVAMQGTPIAPRATMNLKIESRKGFVEIDINRGAINHLEPARRYGVDFHTYVLWAVSVDGKALNLGEITFDGRNPVSINVTTPSQTFWLMVTAEPDYAVVDPSPLVVLYSLNQDGVTTDPEKRAIPVPGRLYYYTHYTQYDNSPSTAPLDVPNELLQARKAIELAKKSGILASSPTDGARTDEEERARATLAQAREFLDQAENIFAQQSSNRDVIQYSRTATQIAENARALALGAVGGIFITQLEAELADVKAEAAKLQKEVERLNVENEPLRREAARFREERDDAAGRLSAAQQELARLNARVGQLEAELVQERETVEGLRASLGELEALQQEGGAMREGLQAEIAALRESHEAEMAAARQEQQAQAAEFERKLSGAAAEYETLSAERDSICGELRRQLSSLGELNDQGGSMALTLASDILFDFGSADLRPAARENLAKLAILRLLLFPDAEVRYEGHTDLVGEEDYNQWLSEQRALSVYRYFLEQARSVASDPADRDTIDARLARTEKLLGMSYGRARQAASEREELIAGLDGAVVGQGEREPVVDTEREEERNRRVVLHFPPTAAGSLTSACEAPAAD